MTCSPRPATPAPRFPVPAWCGWAVLAFALLAQAAGARAATVYTNSLGMQFVAVGGTRVLFSRWETRVGDYAAFREDTGRPWTPPEFEQGPDHPVVNVSWEDSVAFCAWLTRREREAGWLPSGVRYRLPSSAEWDRAVGLPARSGDALDSELLMDRRLMRRYPWGGDWPPPAGAGNYHPVLGVDGFAFTSPVGSFAPNRRGIFDLGGNVWEWCSDWYSDSPDYRVLRGASWRMRNPGDLLSVFRVGNLTSLRLDTYGFRCVLESPKGGAAALNRRAAKLRGQE